MVKTLLPDHFAAFIRKKHLAEKFDDLIGRLLAVWEKWYFSIVNVIVALSNQKTPRSVSTYGVVLKKRKKEVNELLTICKQLEMAAVNGKKRLAYEKGWRVYMLK